MRWIRIRALKPVMDNFYTAERRVSEAQTTALNLLDKIRQADGIFCPNESSTLGMLNVLEQNNLAGKIHFVGFDATPPLMEALKKGEDRCTGVAGPDEDGI